jgi:hypothetical protein
MKNKLLSILTGVLLIGSISFAQQSSETGGSAPATISNSVPIIEVLTEKDVVKTGQTATEKAEKECKKLIFGQNTVQENKSEIVRINKQMNKSGVSVIEYNKHNYETASYKTKDSATVAYFIKGSKIKDKDVIIKTNDLVSISPNPFTQSSTLYLNFDITKHKNICCVIYNTMGKEVMKIENISSNKTTISANDLEKGTYVYKVFSESGLSYTGKFIIN